MANPFDYMIGDATYYPDEAPANYLEARQPQFGFARRPYYAQRGYGGHQGVVAPFYPNNPAIPQYDPDTINRVLGQYGTQLPDQIQPNVFFQGGAFDRHPRIASVLDAITRTVANIQPSSTVGEGISNVARGLLGGKAMQDQYIAQQVQAPLTMAKQVSDLQDAEAQRRMQILHGYYYAKQAQRDYLAEKNAGKRKYSQIVPNSRDGNLYGVRTDDGTPEMLTNPDGSPLGSVQVAESQNRMTRFKTRVKGDLGDYLNGVESELGRQLTPDEELSHIQKYEAAKSKGRATGKALTINGQKLTDVQKLQYRDIAMNVRQAESNMGRLTNLVHNGLANTSDPHFQQDINVAQQALIAAHNEQKAFMESIGANPKAKTPTGNYSPDNPYAKKK